jgi:hypothetical protein
MLHNVILTVTVSTYCYCLKLLQLTVNLLTFAVTVKSLQVTTTKRAASNSYIISGLPARLSQATFFLIDFLSAERQQ